MKASKPICLLLALLLCAGLFAACAKEPAETTAPPADADTTAAPDETTAAEEETSAEETPTVDPNDIFEAANRVPARFAGTYVSGRCSIEAVAVSETEMKFTVRWGADAAESRVWEMSGTMDPDTLNVAFTDCVCKDVTYGADGAVVEETLQYENGSGSIQFYDFTSLCWTDDRDHVASGLTFVLSATE